MNGKTLRFFLILILFVFVAISSVSAQSTFTMLNNPGGGRIVYGQVVGQKNEAGAMAFALHAFHEQFGVKPQVGKLFQVKGTQSVAAFFTIASSKGQVNGLLISTKAATDHVEAAAVYDDAKRFGTTFNPMMKKLFEVWHPLASASGGAHGGGSPIPPLHKVVLPDHSASVEIPENWQVDMRASAGGTIIAKGPSNEVVSLGVTFLASDPRNPAVQRTMAMLRQGMLQNSMYAKMAYVPYGQDPVQTFVALVQHTRQMNGAPQATLHYGAAESVPTQGPTRCFHFSGEQNMNDGTPQKSANVVYCMQPPSSTGSWLSSAYVTAVPVENAAKEGPTVGAILQSFQVDMNVVNAQASAMAAPAIHQIHEIGRAAAAQAKAAHEIQEIHDSSVYQRWDDQDKRNQAFSNYLLDQKVIQDNDNNAHGTFWNQTADDLVKYDPKRYEYVDAPNFWKGIDY